MAMYPTPRSEAYEREQKVIQEDRSLRAWVHHMYPHVYHEWKCINDIERSVKDE